MSKKEVVFVIYSLRGGGAERVLTLLANTLISQFQVTIILLSKQDVFFDLNSLIYVLEPSFKKNKPNKLIYLIRQAVYLRKTIKKIKPDAVFSFMESINSFVLLSLAGIPTKKFVSNRASPLSSLKGFRGLVNPLIYPLADGVIVQTQKAIEILEKKYKKVRFLNIPNPVLIPESIAPVSSREKVIVNVGFLGGKKNQEALIRMFSQLPGKEDWQLVLVGDGPDRKRLENLVEELNEKENISFLGSRQDVPNLLQKAQIFAFTSQTEGFPNALAEAMAHGCACISYDCVTGPSELIQDGKNGFLINFNDQEKYLEKLALLIQNETLREKFSLAAHISVKKFELEKVAKLYKELI